MKKLLLLSALILIYSCNNDDLEPYDPIAQLQADLSLIDMHLASNGQSVMIHSSGIRYTIENEGQGAFPITGDSVLTQYDIYTLGGILVDTTDEDLARANGIYSSGDNYDEFLFKIGVGHVIEGYEIGTGLLNTGAEGTFYIPSTLAYKNASTLSLGPNQILRIKIQVQEIF